MHLLEPERRPPTARIEEVLVGAVAPRLIPENCPPEWQHLGGNGRAGDDKQALDCRRVGREAQPPGAGRNLPGQAAAPPPHPPDAAGDRNQGAGPPTPRWPWVTELGRTVAPSRRTPTPGWWSSPPGSTLIAWTSRAPAANDPVRKYAHAPSPRTRQFSTPSDSWNCVGLIRSVMQAS